MKLPLRTSFFACFIMLFSFSGFGQSLWTEVSRADLEGQTLAYRNSTPQNYTLYQLNTTLLKELLTQAPPRFSGATGILLNIPNARGKLQSFRVYEASVMEAELQHKYSQIRSYAAQGITDPTAVVRFSVSPFGVHWAIHSADQPTIYIDPYTQTGSYYILYDVNQLPAPDYGFVCAVEDSMIIWEKEETLPHTELAAQNGGVLKEFKLALACTHQYAQYHLNNQGISPGATDGVKKSAVLAEMNTALTRINAVYETDFGISLNLVNNNDALIFLQAATDPYTNNDLGAMLGQNQVVCDSLIGTNNYDLGHVFSAANVGGLAYVGVICNNYYKAQGGTGLSNPISDYFYVNYVSHELGHQFGANHTFSGNNGGCGGNGNFATAVEPGSGSTIMSYAGICAGQNIQGQSDDYFNAVSIAEVWVYLNLYGNYCAQITSTNNMAPVADAGLDYVIPKSTPFVLQGTATHPDGDGQTYTWEETDASLNASQPPISTNAEGPLFRSLPPQTTAKRYLPRLSTVLAGNLANTWEVLPSIARNLNFRFTVRDNHAGGGAVDYDDMSISVAGNAGPFKVTSQNSPVVWNTPTVTLTWAVANTQLAPVSCNTVDIFFSSDGGQSFTDTLALNVPNTGSVTVNTPTESTSQGRIMIKGSDNIFFDINDAAIEVTENMSVATQSLKDFSVYPNPSAGVFNVKFSSLQTEEVEVSIYNLQGKRTWYKAYDNINAEQLQLNLHDLQPGMYFIIFESNLKKAVQKIIVE